jgi:hypothetical protein
LKPQWRQSWATRLLWFHLRRTIKGTSLKVSHDYCVYNSACISTMIICIQHTVTSTWRSRTEIFLALSVLTMLFTSVNIYHINFHRQHEGHLFLLPYAWICFQAGTVQPVKGWDHHTHSWCGWGGSLQWHHNDAAGLGQNRLHGERFGSLAGYSVSCQTESRGKLLRVMYVILHFPRETPSWSCLLPYFQGH